VRSKRSEAKSLTREAVWTADEDEREVDGSIDVPRSRESVRSQQLLRYKPVEVDSCRTTERFDGGRWGIVVRSPHETKSWRFSKATRRSDKVPASSSAKAACNVPLSSATVAMSEEHLIVWSALSSGIPGPGVPLAASESKEPECGSRECRASLSTGDETTSINF
jgi:hypothetical protein